MAVFSNVLPKKELSLASGQAVACREATSLPVKRSGFSRPMLKGHYITCSKTLGDARRVPRINI